MKTSFVHFEKRLRNQFNINFRKTSSKYIYKNVKNIFLGKKINENSATQNLFLLAEKFILNMLDVTII